MTLEIVETVAVPAGGLRLSCRSSLVTLVRGLNSSEVFTGSEYDSYLA